MTDRELLEAAAKAVGYDTSHPWNATRLTLNPPVAALCIPGHSSGWNPLEDDGYALRLANDLDISIIFGSCLDDAPIVTAKYFDGEVTLPNFPDPHAATRRAVVLAAVEINKLREWADQLCVSQKPESETQAGLCITDETQAGQSANA